MGLAVQGGSGTLRHVDGMLDVLRGPHADAQRPRLVHRLDKDTAGCLLVAKTRFAASALAILAGNDLCSGTTYAGGDGGQQKANNAHLDVHPGGGNNPIMRYIGTRHFVP